MEKLNLKVNGTVYEVEVGDLNDCPIRVVVNGANYFVEIEGAKVITRPVATAVAAPVPVVQIRTPTPVPVPAPVMVSGNGNGNDLRAPMPGIIHNISVKPGDSVKAGQQVIALEAMKMKSAIRATHDSVVASVEVSEGQKVAFGQVLIRFA